MCCVLFLPLIEIFDMQLGTFYMPIKDVVGALLINDKLYLLLCFSQ